MSEFTDLRGTDKIQALYDANARKLESLAQASVTTREKLAAQSVLNQDSWVSQAGLEPDSVAGGLVNAAASYTTGAGRVMGQLSSLPASVASEMKLNSLTPEDTEAYNAVQAGTATPEQQQRLATKRAMGGDPNQRAVPLPDDPHAREAQLAREALQQSFRARNQKSYPVASPEQKIDESNNLRQLARDINTGFDFKSTVNQTARTGLSEQLREGFPEEWKKIKEGGAGDKLSGVANLIAKAGSAALDNKQAVGEFIVENLPQMAMGMAGPAGMAGMSASNAGYAMDNYQKGIEKFQADNKGALPDEATRREMALWALSTAAAEQAGDVVSLGGAKAFKGALQAAKNAVGDVGTATARSAFKAALRTPLAVAEGAGTEAVTEGYQTFAEGKAGLKEATPADIYESAAIGGMVGGAMRGAPTAAAQVVEGASNFDSAVASKSTEMKAAADANAAAVKTATESGDITGLVDPTKKTYAPDVAISALFNRAQTADATPEVKAENLSKATEVVESLQQQIDLAKEDLAETAPDKVAEYKERLADPATTEDQRTLLQELIADAPKSYKDASTRLAQLNNLNSKAQEALGNFTRETNNKEVDVKAEVDLLKTSAPEVAQQSAEKIISVAMRDAGRLDENVAAKLAADESVNMTPEQRGYLRAFSEARLAENTLSTMGKVSQEVLNGSAKNAGIAQYRQRMSAAIASGNEAVAERQKTQLQAFAQDHASKATAAEAALNEGIGAQIIRKTGGGWEVAAVPLSLPALRRNGGLEVNSGRLVQAIKAESDALGKAAAEMNAAFDMSFRSNTKEGTANVKDVSPVTQPSQTESGSAPSDTEVVGVQAKPTANNDAGRVAKDDDAKATNAGVNSSSAPRVQVGPNVDSFVNVNAQQSRDIADRFGLTDKIEAALAEGKTLAQVKMSLGNDLRLIPQEDRTGFLTNVRATLGIPSRGDTDGQKEFELWKAAYDARKTQPTQVTGQLLKKLDERMEYLANPPADYTTEKAQKIGEWATRQVARIDAEMATAEKGSDLRESLADARAQAKRLVAKATAVVAGDASLSSIEGEVEATPVPAAPVEAVAEPVVSPAMEVFTLDKTAEKAKPFQEQNLVAVYLKQAKNIALGKTKDFIDTVGSLAAAIPDKTFSEGQEAALTFLQKKVAEWGTALDANVVQISKDFRYRDPFQFMLNEDGTMGKNVHTAMSVAVVDYVSQFGTRTLFNSWEDINTILRRPKDQQVTPAESALLKDVGVQAVTVTGSIGAQATRVLGIKDTPDAPKNLLPKVQASMGAHIVDLMLDKKILVKSTVTGAELNAAMELNEGDSGSYKNAVVFTFYKLNTDADGNFAPQVSELFDQARQAKGAFTDLFGTEVGVIAPLFEAKDFNQREIDGTDRGIPAVLKQANDKLQKTPLKLKQDHWNLLSALPENVVLALAGYQENLTGLQKSLQDGVMSSNLGIKKGWEGLKTFIADHLEGVLDKEFFVQPKVWVNQRVGIATQLIDPQANKLHRYLTKMDTWNTTVDMNNADALRNFSLRVMEGLGAKTDETPDDVTIQGFDSLVSKPEFAAAIAAIRKHLQGQKLTEEDADDIATGTAKGGEKMHSFDALMALAKFEEAQVNGLDSFEAEMSVEDDGKTNGPMLSMLLFGAADHPQTLAENMARGGFYSQASGIEQYSQWRVQPGNEDLYQDTMRVFNAALSANLNAASGNPAYLEKVKAIYAFTGTLVNDKTNTVEKAGRNIVKTPLQAIFFGSSSKRSAESMADKLIEGILDRVQKLQSNPDDRASLIRDLNTLGLKIDAETSAETLMDAEFTKSEIRTLQNTFMQYVGDSVKEVVDTHFAPFMEAKKKMNAAANLAFTMYDTVFKVMKEQKIAELVKSGEIPVSKGKNAVALFDLSRNQEQSIHDQLKDIFPQMHSWMSQMDGNIDNGIRLAKEDSSVSDDSKYLTEVKTKSGTHRVRSQEKNMIEPGVMPLSASVHSFDSGISHMAGMEVDSFNNHDARTTGLNELNALAKSLNKATWDGLVSYSPLASAGDALGNVIKGMARMDGAAPWAASAAAAILKAVEPMASRAKMTPQEYINNTLMDIRGEQARADKLKLEFLSTLGAVDQYPLQGGSYIVTDADRATAAELIKHVPTKLDPEENAARIKLLKVLGATPDEQVQTLAIREEGPAPTPNSTAWGELGTPPRTSDLGLVSFFEETPNLKAKELIAKLREVTASRAQDPARDFSMKLLGMLTRVVDPELPVKYITRLTPASDVMGNIPGALAWYSKSASRHQIAVIGNDYKHSRVNAPMLIHELVHSAVFGLMNAERAKKAKNPKYRSEVTDMIEDLETLREAVNANINSRGLAGKYGRAVENIDELIAYGMMLPDFQQEVLAQVSVPRRNLRSTKSALVNGLKAFIETLTNLVFAGAKRTATQNDIDGLSLLMANTTAIMYEVSRNIKNEADARAESTSSLAMMGDPMADLSNMDTVGLYNNLSSGVSQHAAEFHDRVKALLTGIVNKLHGPFGSLKDKVIRDQASDALDVMMKSAATGQAPFVADVVGSPFRASHQELFAMEQVETTVRAAIDGGEASTTSIAYTQLSKLYREARARIKPEAFLKDGGSWATATAQEKADAQAQHDFVFTIQTNNDNRSAYLSRFAALGLAHEKFSGLLDFNTALIDKATESGLTIGERLQRVFERFLDVLGSGFVGSFAGQKANDKLNVLVNRLVDIEAKRKVAAARGTTGWVAKLESNAKDFSQTLRKKVGAVAGSPTVRNAASGYVRGAGAVVRVVANDQVEAFLDGISIFRDQTIKKRHSIIRDMMTEVQGVPDRMMKLLLDAKRANEQVRQDMISSTEKTVMGMFMDGGKKLSIAAREGVTQSLLRTGAHILLKNNRFTMDEVRDLVSKQSSRDTAIQTLESELKASQGTSTFAAYYMEKANVLGYYKATGQVRGAKMLMNAHNIARLYTTPQASKVTEADAAIAEPLIEALVALYALDYTGSVDRKQASDVMLAEANRVDGQNGVEFMMKLQAKMEAEALDKLFSGNRSLMVHGYTPELYNSRTEIKVADDVDGPDLELQGWKKIGGLSVDPHDPNKKVAQNIYVLKGAGLQPYLSATMSLTDMAAKGGDKLHSGILNPLTVNGLANAQTLSGVVQAHDAYDQILMRAPSGYTRQDLAKASGTFMAPILNDQGSVVNFRYLMSENTKDTVLERDSRFEKVLGALAGSVYDKENSRTQNMLAVKALKEEYTDTYKERPGSFVLVGRDSTDPAMREIWNLLPEGTKQDVQEVWGYSGMMVRLDSLNVLFGYRKFSLAEMFRKDPSARGQMENLATFMLEWTLKNYGMQSKGLTADQADLYAKRAAVYVARGEQVWQELVKEVKDIIVVKSGIVMAGNIWSNLSFLMFSGVPLKSIITHHKVAMQGATAYLADTQELARLQAMKDTGYLQGNQTETDREIARLKDAIERNPVKEIINAGLMPTIVDDVALQDDPYSYKSNLTRWVEGRTDWMPEGMKNAAKQVYMAKDTGVYQALSRITQLSDFVARYTLYQHLINDPKNPRTKEEAVVSASESFINYDVPLPKGLQYTDDMGLTMFTKYFLRVQRVLVKMIRENPARVLGAIALGQVMDLGPVITDSSWVSHIGNNPLNAGAFQYPTTLDELMSAQAAMSVFK